MQEVCEGKGQPREKGRQGGQVTRVDNGKGKGKAAASFNTSPCGQVR